ncbi:tRNA preQ1(34) S-adenosylmethionine ribosyltransferase-isomerase QueA [Sulfuriroseicoccus oceanibius]|uniref:tRNA preQ1(34) S-adenosylmethionine ribosyltransferase-isomerase QueA n=1 Tax=Sulfuriroseicoccus oceanibius TaxID=2707525 RepID=UPI0013BE8850
MRTDDFDYELPEELIASRPPERREESRMLVVNRAKGTIEHRRFAEFPSFIRQDDLCVFNNTQVVPARFFSNDGKIELVWLEDVAENTWRCMVRPGKKMKVGRTVEIGDAVGTVIEVRDNGDRIVRFDREVDLNRGELALPHYMGRDSDSIDSERYQTVFASERGAIAAPTAGLHFTPEILEQVPHKFVTLHVGIGTFRPVKAENVVDHKMHAEWYHMGGETAEAIRKAGRVVAVGTTVVRTLESVARDTPRDQFTEASGDTDIFIYPPYQFGAVDALLTNFHLPKSTLLMLVSAFAGKELMMEAYRQAVEERYRFFSYGDCMLIL